jgi:hypothetical protein
VNLILDSENPLTDSDAANQGDLHMQAGDVVTIIDPEGAEIYVMSHPVDGTLEVVRA